MKLRFRSFCYLLILFIVVLFSCEKKDTSGNWTINDLEYLESPGLSLLAFHTFYPGGKQGGIEIIHHGERIATNGFIRMERINCKRFPYPEGAERTVDAQNLIINSVVNYDNKKGQVIPRPYYCYNWLAAIFLQPRSLVSQ